MTVTILTVDDSRTMRDMLRMALVDAGFRVVQAEDGLHGLDVLRGDSTLFTRSDELEEAWKFVTPILDYWENEAVRPEPYAANTWGPVRADQLLAANAHKWRMPQAQDVPKKT